MRSYSNNGANPGPFSNTVSETISGNPPPTAVGTVTSAGQVWMDRNLGASRAAISSTDQAAYGHLYQWGRLADGHESRTSPTTSTNSTTDVPGHGNFITSQTDWRSPRNDNLWQGESGINNPCPSGFRLPTSTEWMIERNSWGIGNYNNAGAMLSALKVVAAGGRGDINGNISHSGNQGNYWTSTVDGSSVRRMWISINQANFYESVDRAHGFSVRCIKD